jgi:hypothetical protein
VTTLSSDLTDGSQGKFIIKLEYANFKAPMSGIIFHASAPGLGLS